MKTLLATFAALACLAVPASAATLVQNGSFEDPVAASPLVNGGNWWVWKDIPGWSTTSGAGIEIQTNDTLGSINAKEGNRYVELDSHPGPHSNSTMTQKVNLSKDGYYLLSFWYSPRDSQTASNDIGYSFGDFASGLVKGPVAGVTKVGEWTQITAKFLVSFKDLGNHDLSFWATGTENTYGGLLDDVSLTHVAPVPLPAAGLLMIGGLGGLAALSRRRRS